MSWKKSIENAAHYIWGDQCHGWHLLQSDTLSVIQESMPSGTSEELHYHQHAQQLFYVLSGTATFLVEKQKVIVEAGESIHIPPKIPHQIQNLSSKELQFLVISQPRAHGDRVTLGEEDKS